MFLIRDCNSQSVQRYLYFCRCQMLFVLSILLTLLIKISWTRASLKLSRKSALIPSQYNRLLFPSYCICETRIVPRSLIAIRERRGKFEMQALLHELAEVSRSARRVTTFLHRSNQISFEISIQIRYQ